MGLKSISFIDIEGQRFNFELDAEDEIFSLFLLPKNRRGVHTLVINGQPEVYFFRPKDILYREVAA